MQVRPADLNDPDVIALVRLHLEGMHATSPPENVFALDMSGLRRPDVVLFAAWIEGRPAGMGAIKELSPTHGEIKSMRTHPDFLRKGVGARILDHLITIARQRGYTKLSLETGSGETFEPALALYRARGFVLGEAFADYPPSAFSQFMHLGL